MSSHHLTSDSNVLKVHVSGCRLGLVVLVGFCTLVSTVDRCYVAQKVEKTARTECWVTFCKMQQDGVYHSGIFGILS